MAYFSKAHEGIQTQKYSRPDLREGYDLLIEYYGEVNEKEKELFYIKKLLPFDKEINQKFKYLSYKVHKEYDTKSLIEKKEKTRKRSSFKQKRLLCRGCQHWH